MKGVSFLFLPFKLAIGTLTTLPLVGSTFDGFLSWLVAATQLGSGSSAASNITSSPRPEKILELYSFVACPFCRKVEETMSSLCLDVKIYSVPKENMSNYGETSGSRYRQQAKDIGGKVMFPLLVDSNTKVVHSEVYVMYESSDIVRYLWKTYGKGAKPDLGYKILQQAFPLRILRSLLRPLGRHGMTTIKTKKPEKDLVLWGFESSPYVTLVREVLCSMEMCYVYRTCPKFNKSKRREYIEHFKSKGVIEEFLPKGGLRRTIGVLKFPILEDPNTGVVMSESRDIIAYLYKTYALK
eukprot:maker-scaffold_7-snap-gene-4.1-mRNA-1 protein AED:0.06 eAED:0.06 QI:0/0.66/0.75/1/1/1/4/644/296